MMIGIELAQATYSLQGLVIANTTGDRVAGVGRIDDNATALKRFDRLRDQAWLRVIRVNS